MKIMEAVYRSYRSNSIDVMELSRKLHSRHGISWVNKSTPMISSRFPKSIAIAKKYSWCVGEHRENVSERKLHQVFLGKTNLQLWILHLIYCCLWSQPCLLKLYQLRHWFTNYGLVIKGLSCKFIQDISYIMHAQTFKCKLRGLCTHRNLEFRITT